MPRWTHEQAAAHQDRVGKPVPMAASRTDTSTGFISLPPEPRPKRPRKVSLKPSEADIQASAVDALRSLGYVVLVTGRTNVPVVCKKCGTKTWGSPTNDIGTPDTFVSHPMWNGLFLAIEYKEPNKGKPSAEQANLAKGGYSCIVDSVFSALSAAYMAGYKHFGMDDEKLFNMAQEWFPKAKKEQS